MNEKVNLNDSGVWFSGNSQTVADKMGYVNDENFQRIYNELVDEFQNATVCIYFGAIADGCFKLNEDLLIKIRERENS